MLICLIFWNLGCIYLLNLMCLVLNDVIWGFVNMLVFMSDYGRNDM